jgi:hypothetical protein
MTYMFLDRPDILAASSGLVAEEWQLRVSSDGKRHGE